MGKVTGHMVHTNTHTHKHTHRNFEKSLKFYTSNGIFDGKVSENPKRSPCFKCLIKYYSCTFYFLIYIFIIEYDFFHITIVPQSDIPKTCINSTVFIHHSL